MTDTPRDTEKKVVRPEAISFREGILDFLHHYAPHVVPNLMDDIKDAFKSMRRGENRTVGKESGQRTLARVFASSPDMDSVYDVYDDLAVAAHQEA